MYGALIGAGLKAAGSIAGAITSARAAKNAKDQIVKQQEDNEAWYNRRYNEDATQRADAQRMITMVSDSIKKRNRAAAGTAAVMGGTTESVAAAKEANNQALADTTSQIGQRGGSQGCHRGAVSGSQGRSAGEGEQYGACEGGGYIQGCSRCR